MATSDGRGMFAGYSPDSPAWLILNPCSERIREAYHAKFVESEPGLREEQEDDKPHTREVPGIHQSPPMTGEAQGARAIPEGEDNPEQRTQQDEALGLRRSARAGTPRDLWDHSSVTKGGTEKLGRERQALPNEALLATTETAKCEGNEPRNWREAIRSRRWLASMKQERDTLRSMGAYTLVRRDGNIRVESGIWRFRAKLDQDGNVAKLKSRYVLDESKQWSPLGKEDTYSPVAELSSIRMILTCTVEEGWEVIQADFTTAYLNAKLDEPVYMQQPPGLEEGSNQTVWKLIRVLYGMKQSGKLWYNVLKGALKNLGYRPAVTDPCVFTRKHENAKDIITVYVDDLLVTGTADKGRLNTIIAELGNIYNVTNLGTVRHLLGISISRAKDGLRLDQTAFIRKALEEEGTPLTLRSIPWNTGATRTNLEARLTPMGRERTEDSWGKRHMHPTAPDQTSPLRSPT